MHLFSSEILYLELGRREMGRGRWDGADGRAEGKRRLMWEEGEGYHVEWA